MLRPIAQHHYNTGKHKRNDKDEKCCFEIDKTHTQQQEIKRQIRHNVSRRYIFFRLRLNRYMNVSRKPRKKKSRYISHEVAETVPLVGKGAAGIVFHIILYMVHGHVVNKIRFRGMPEKRANDPDDPIVNPGILLS